MAWDIWEEPWIPVENPQGIRETVNLRDFFRHAADYTRFNGVTVFEEVGMRRFFSTFLMAALRPRNEQDIRLLFLKGHLPMDEIEDYIRFCIEDGVSFDIFDTERPFLQAPFSLKYDEGKEKSVAELNPLWPSGDTVIHLNHQREQDAVMAPDEAFRYLLAVPAFGIASTAGAGLTRPFGINGTPPLYWFVEGRNLFESLILNMVPIPKDAGGEPEVWLSHTTIAPWVLKGSKKKDNHITETSFLYGLLFPCRRITLTRDTDGMVRTIYYQQGLNYKGTDWVDPYVGYICRKGVKSTLKPRIGTPIYQAVQAMCSPDGTLPGVWQQYMSVCSKRTLRIRYLGAVKDSNKAKYLDITAGTIPIPKEDWRRAFWLQQLERIEAVGFELKSSIKILFGMSAVWKAGTMELETTAQLFQERAYDLLYHITAQTTPGSVDTGAANQTVWDGLQALSRGLLRDLIEARCVSAGECMQAAQAEKFLNIRLQKRWDTYEKG